MNHLINNCKACPKCGKTDKLQVRNYSRVLQEGEVWCKNCNVFVRDYDAS